MRLMSHVCRLIGWRSLFCQTVVWQLCVARWRICINVEDASAGACRWVFLLQYGGARHHAVLADHQSFSLQADRPDFYPSANVTAFGFMSVAALGAGAAMCRHPLGDANDPGVVSIPNTTLEAGLLHNDASSA